MNTTAMKPFTLIVLSVVGLLAPVASAQYQQPPPQVNVSGVGEIRVAPDEVHISAGVETRDAQLNAATRRNDERIATALAFLRKAGVPDKDIQTDAMQVLPDYGSGDRSLEPEFYRVRKSISLRLTEVTNLESVVTGLLTNGVNGLYNVDFRTTALRKYRDQARSMAIKAAREKAVALCGDLGVACGKPLSINAQEFGGSYSWSGSGWGNGFGWRGANSYVNSVQNVSQVNDSGGSFAGDNTAIGQIQISATVNVTFLIQ